MFHHPITVHKNLTEHNFSDFHTLDRRIEIGEALERIDINWQKGDIRIRSSSGVQKPYAQIKNGEANIIYKESGGVLYIADKSGKTRFRFVGNAPISSGDLEIVFPSDYTLNALSISAVTGGIRFEEIRLHSADFISVNSDVRIFGYAEDIRINTVSGDKDFLESDVEKPLIFSPTMLYDYLSK